MFNIGDACVFLHAFSDTCVVLDASVGRKKTLQVAFFLRPISAKNDARVAKRARFCARLRAFFRASPLRRRRNSDATLICLHFFIMLSFGMDRSVGPVTYRRPADGYLRSSSVSLTHSGSSSFQSQTRSRRSAPSYSESPEPPNGPRDEREALQGLNERFAGYIDKVRRLEEQNQSLQQEAAALRKQQAGISAIGQLYQREIKDIRNQLLKINSENIQEQLEANRLNEDIDLLRLKTQEEERMKEESVSAERALRQYLQDCTLESEQIGRKVQALQDEVSHLCKSHQEDVDEMLRQIQGSQVSTQQFGEMPGVDLASALKEIRAQLEGHIGRNNMQTQDWFQVQLEKLNEASNVNTQAIRSASDEITSYRHQLQSKITQLEVLKGSQQSLERQCMDLEDRHQAELTSYQVTCHHYGSDSD
ncbi:unnamed protein product [Ranitomeya imitator]|uniref:IF rod domain-containing protein n=1 Tax=Ranitomeya imitator TaxID=111125 RepID=A0ABN9KUE5_9NEOB|nr:unnamed protein product [Ranitomeya imitator]